MQKEFKKVEEAFGQLKRKYRLEKISRQEFIYSWEKLRLKDEDGRFWMIGMRSDKWYYFDGKDWVQSAPLWIKDKKASCVYCGFENKLEAEACAGCGRSLWEENNFIRKISPRRDEYSQELPLHKRDEEEREERNEEVFGDEGGANFLFRSISPLSFFRFWGIIGLFVGTIMGAFAGASNYFSGIAKILPDFIQENKGNLLGGIIYSGLGGVLGFIFFGLFGFLNALFINVISSFVGGIKMDIERISEK